MRRFALIPILVLALALRLYGLDWGLPNHRHAQPYNPDEWTPMKSFQNMRPAALDFNPHFFNDPTFHYYAIAAGIFAGHLAGLHSVKGTERYYFEHPEDLASMIRIGRLLSVLLGTATVWLVYRLARRLSLGRNGSLLAALLAALFPSLLVHSKFMTVNAPVTFWIVAAFLAAERWIRRGGWKSFLFAGLTAGLALSTKYSAALLAPVFLVAGHFRAREIGSRAIALRELLLVSVLTLCFFLLGSPYILLAFGEFAAMVRGFLLPAFAAHRGGPPAPTVLRNIAEVYLCACTPLVLLAAAGGLALFARRRSPLRILVLLWTLGFLAISLKSGHLASDSRFLPLFPFLAILAAAGLASLAAARRRAGAVLLALTLGSLALWDQALLARFTGPQPQESASDWARSHLTGKESVHLGGASLFYHPDLPYREFLHDRNPANYERETEWTFVVADSYRVAKAAAPDVVFLTLWLPRSAANIEWLDDPDYEVVAHFPGKIRLFGKRVFARLDVYDVESWVLERKRRD